MDFTKIRELLKGLVNDSLPTEEVEKIRFLRRAGFRGDIAVDGGVSIQNAPLLAEAGATLLVMGTSYFRAEDPAKVARFVEELNA